MTEHARPRTAEINDVDEVGATGLMTAAIRADESLRPDRMFDDPYAGHFAGDTGRELLAELDGADLDAAVSSGQVTRAYVALRTRFMDDALRAALAEQPAAQVVIVAAGMDARAYRHPWLAGVPVYELDRAAVLEYKQRVLDELGGTPYATRRPVPAELAADWSTPLVGAGFEPGRPSVWLAEGLLCYLEPSDAAALLATIGSLAAPGSRLAVDLVNADMLAVPETRDMLLRYEKWGCPWLFGTNHPAELLAEHGFTAVVNRPGAAPYDHPRWPLPLAPAEVPNVPRSFFVEAARVEAARDAC